MGAQANVRQFKLRGMQLALLLLTARKMLVHARIHTDQRAKNNFIKVLQTSKKFANETVSHCLYLLNYIAFNIRAFMNGNKRVVTRS